MQWISTLVNLVINRLIFSSILVWLVLRPRHYSGVVSEMWAVVNWKIGAKRTYRSIFIDRPRFEQGIFNRSLLSRFSVLSGWSCLLRVGNGAPTSPVGTVTSKHFLMLVNNQKTIIIWCDFYDVSKNKTVVH